MFKLKSSIWIVFGIVLAGLAAMYVADAETDAYNNTIILHLHRDGSVTLEWWLFNESASPFVNPERGVLRWVWDGSYTTVEAHGETTTSVPEFYTLRIGGAIETTESTLKLTVWFTLNDEKGNTTTSLDVSAIVDKQKLKGSAKLDIHIAGVEGLRKYGEILSSPSYLQSILSQYEIDFIRVISSNATYSDNYLNAHVSLAIDFTDSKYRENITRVLNDFNVDGALDLNSSCKGLTCRYNFKLRYRGEPVKLLEIAEDYYEEYGSSILPVSEVAGVESVLQPFKMLFEKFKVLPSELLLEYESLQNGVRVHIKLFKVKYSDDPGVTASKLAEYLLEVNETTKLPLENANLKIVADKGVEFEAPANITIESLAKSPLKVKVSSLQQQQHKDAASQSEAGYGAETTTYTRTSPATKDGKLGFNAIAAAFVAVVMIVAILIAVKLKH